MLKLLLLILFLGAIGQAQDQTQTVILVNGTPTGACPARKLAVDYANNLLYFCSNSVWVLTTGAGAGYASQFGSYLLSVSGGTVSARNNLTGVVDYTGADAAVVINSVLGAMATTGGTIFFKNGIYNLNSVSLESNAGCTNYYAIGIPAAAHGSQVQWIFEGESRPVTAQFALGSGIQNNGVILYVTQTAIDSVAANVNIYAIWQRPINTGSSCSFPTSGAAYTGDDHFKNLLVRFPTNQRGNESGIVMWGATGVGYENVGADFNLDYNTMDGTAPVKGSIGSYGLTTTFSGSMNEQRFSNTFAVGWDMGYDLQSEHVVGDTMTAAYCNYPAEFGRAGTAVYHPSIIRHFIDQENLNGMIFGPQMQAGSRVDLIGHDIELGAVSKWYAHAGNAPLYTESTPGNTSGSIDYTAVLQGTGMLSNTVLFSSGGQKFSYPALASVFDGFTRANAALTAPWVQVTGTGTNALSITSNLLTCAGNTCEAHYDVDSTYNQRTGVIIDTVPTGTDQAFVYTRLTGTTASPTTLSGYECVYVSGTGMQMYKTVTGVGFTQLGSTVASTPAAKSLLEMESIGTVHTCYLSGVPIIRANDTAVSAGHPGVGLLGTTGKLGMFTARNLQ